MKKTRHSNKIFKRVVSMATALVLLSGNLPMQEIGNSFKLIDFSRFAITANAVPSYDVSKFEGTVDGVWVNKVIGMNMSESDFAEYSRCYYYDSGFASRHSGDVITLSPTSEWMLQNGSEQFCPLGTAANPFAGTIRVNAIDSTSMLLLMDAPFFDVVYDTVHIYKGNTSDSFTLEFIKITSNENPLMANEVRHSGTGGAVWKANLSGRTITKTFDNGSTFTYGNSYSYGGAIGKISEDAMLNLQFTDDSTASQGAYVKRSTAQGVLCGEMASGASLTASYINSTGRAIAVGDGSNSNSGGLVGTMTGANFTLTSASSLNFDVKSGTGNAGLLVGYAVKDVSNNSSSISLPDGLTVSGSATGRGEKVGGLVGSLQNSDITIADNHTVTLSGVTVTGENKVGGIIGNFEPSANSSKTLTENVYTLTNCSIGGSAPGGIIGEYTSVGGESVDVSHFTFTGTTMSSGNAGGVFGKFTAAGDTTITGTFSAPSASTHFGGVIGEYTSGALARTLNLNSLTVNSVNQTADSKRLGGVILNVADSGYISVNGLIVGVTGGANKSNTSNPFGGIVSTLGSTAASGSFIDVVGDYTLTTSSAYNGGAIAGAFKNGVLRLAGTTDISRAQTANGYGQLIYENDTTLVYSKGTGNNSAWTFKRNSSTTASDLGQWGEVVRFSNMETDIVDIDTVEHTVSLKAASTSVTTPTTFAKLALNMQINDGASHGVLLFAQDGDTKNTLLGTTISVSGTIDLSDTGILGLMRDGGNGCYYDVNNTQDESAMKGNPDYFTGTITGTNAIIKLAVGENYGTGSTNGGRIYLSNNNGHSAQGLLSFADGAIISGLTVSGTMKVERVENAGDALHMGAVMGYMTNGATLTNISVSTELDFTRTHQNGRIYIGGVAGLFDGNSTSTLSIIGGTASSSAGSIAPEITLHGSQATYSEDNYNNRNTYIGGILGLLGGRTTSQYGVEIKYTDVSPKIKLGSDVANVNDQYCGGMIGRVRENTTNERTIEINNVTMTSAEVELKSLYSGGLLGTLWDRTQVTIDGLSITGTASDKSKVTNKHSGQVKLSGLVFRATGKWNVNSLSVSNTEFTTDSTNAESFGLIVNQGYRNNDGLYLNLKNSGYSLNGVTLPSSAKNDYYVDEIVANTASGKDAVVNGGNGVGIININMTTSSNTNVNITDIKDDTTGQVTAAGTGTYQNKALNNDKLLSNQNSRYYYNLDIINAKTSQEDGEKFLMWSLYNHYAPTNIKGYNVITNASLTGLTNVDLRGLSYYPVDIAGLTLPAATFRFGFDDIMTLETAQGSDSWARYPNSTGDMTTADETRRNQHYLMQNSLFRNVTGALSTSGAITLKGVFGGVDNAGGIIGDTLTGSADLKRGVTLNNVKPYNSDSPMLVNYIKGTESGVDPKFNLTGLRLTGYPSSGTVAVASALIHNAEGTNMEIIFSDLKIDARNGSITDTNWTTGENSSESAMNKAYGTSRSIFKNATLFNNLKSNATDTIEYNYTWDDDWGTVSGTTVKKRNVTYGQEITNSAYYKDEDDNTKSGERHYSGTKRYFTNPVDGSDTEFSFANGFLPYVKNKNTDSTYNISEVKVNFVSSGLVEGCGTYNDPYIITSASLLNKVAAYINSENSKLDTIKLPNSLNATWHTSDATYHKADPNKVASETELRYYVNTGETGLASWTYDAAREYLAGAYYVIPNDMELPSTFPGIGIGGADENGKTVFHGVIVGKQNESNVADNKYPTITNLSDKPFICISNGSVVKNLNFSIDNKTPPDTKKPNELVKAILLKQNVNQSNALYGYSISFDTSSNNTAKCYGGVFGEIMGGDNIIDNVAVTYTNNRPIKLPKDSNGSKHLISVGGFAGCIVNGGLIFRGNNSVTNFKVYNNTSDNNVTINNNDKNALAEDFTKNLYVNPYVGRVINGYAVNENASSPLNNTDKHYTIDNITPPAETNKLDVNFGASTITVPNAQALFVMSLITQSTAGTAVSPAGDYGVSQSYGVNSGYFCGSNHLGTYDFVGSKKTVHNDETGEDEEVMYTTQSEISDYYNKASQDAANATDANRKLAVPYIISAYTKAYDGTYPARALTYSQTVKPANNKVTDTVNKYWGITLSSNADFATFGTNYPSFRGIGSVGLRGSAVKSGSANLTNDVKNEYQMKVDYFDGGNNTINIAIKMTRYQRDQENYFHSVNKSITQNNYTAEFNNYGIDTQSESLLGLGLFDMTWTKGQSSDYRNFKLTGYVNDVCYNSSGNDVTGKTGDKSQLYCVGGVVGQGYNGFAQNFTNITFDGFSVEGACICGGLIGLDSNVTNLPITIQGCNTDAGGLTVIGGFTGGDDYRHGIGGFVGMSLGDFVNIDGDPNGTGKQMVIKISKVSTKYTQTGNKCNIGGLVGYTGRGVNIRYVRLEAMNTNSFIGSDEANGTNASNAVGFVAFAQRANASNENDAIIIDHCTIKDINIIGRCAAGGFYGRSWDGTTTWCPRYIQITNSNVVGSSDINPVIKATYVNNNNYFAGGLMGAMTASSGTHESYIDSCYVKGYTIQGWWTGGLFGYGLADSSVKSFPVTNCYVEDCTIISNLNGSTTQPAGGLVGYTPKPLYGYNNMIRNIVFKKSDDTDNTANVGAFVGNSANQEIKLIAVSKYADSSHMSNVPTANIKSGTNNKDIIVFADYTGRSLTTGKNTSNISSFGKTDAGGNITDQNKAPYLTLNPSSAIGTGEYISGDGAAQLSDALTGYSTYSSGKSAAARIYADWSATTKPNRAFSNVTVTAPYSGAAVPDIGTFFKQSADSGEFKVSTWNNEMGTRAGVDDFTLLVVNDANDPEKTTNLIDNYIRLMTGTTTHYMADASGKYRIVIMPCRYNSETNKFELVSNVTSGLTKVSTSNAVASDGQRYTNGYYQMSLTNADSKYDDQFTLIDVQYYDPTDTSADTNKRIAYHLYVPVMTKKTVNIEFSAASLSGSEYRMLGYSDKITREIAGGKNANNPTTLVDSMDVWTTTYIRFSYPVSQVNEILKLGSDLRWNHDKKVNIYWGMENNIPDNAKMVLIDPNNNADKAYYATAGQFTVADRTRTVDFSEFTARSNGTGGNFHEQTLYSRLYDKVTEQANPNGKGAYNPATSSTSGALEFKVNDEIKYYTSANGTGSVDLVVTEPIIEDYYLSLLVPKTSGQADVVQIQPAGMANTVNHEGNAATGNVIRATVTSKLNAALIIGDFYRHTVSEFYVTSALNSQIITEANKVLTTTSTATISLIDNEEHTQAAYFANVLSNAEHLYHSFNLQMIRSNSEGKNDDIIKGIEKNNISATYKINNGTEQTISADGIIRETSYIQCTTGDIKSYLVSSANNYSVTITGKAVLDFDSYADEFPSNPNDLDNIGVRGAVRSNISYQEDNLPYSKMYAPHDPVAPYFYTKEDNSALFSFDAVDELDDEEIGTNTKNNSRLGVNDKFVYNNLIHGKSVYNALDVKDYTNATSVTYTLELFRKTTANGSTDYVQVNMPEYITDIELTDTETGNLTKTEHTKTVGAESVTYYEYSRNVDPNGADKDAMFYTDFACLVKKGDDSKKEYANYKIQLTVRLNGSTNNERTSYIIYTNAKIDPTMIDEFAS